MADCGSYGLGGPRLDIEQLQLEAQHRWLRPSEICEILCNYQMFHIASEPPISPRSGSLFLFNRKELRYFRKDGHNWRKKKDGKTVKEAHEKLKVGSIDVLHCYYAHGEDNGHFQRRSYWMLEPDMMDIVFVHYLEVKGNKTHLGGNRDIDEVASDSTYRASPASGAVPLGSIDSMSPTSSLTALCEDADSGDYAVNTGDVKCAGSSVNSNPESLQFGSVLMDNLDAGLLSFYCMHPASDPVAHMLSGISSSSDGSTSVASQTKCGNASWDKILDQCSAGSHGDSSFLPSCGQLTSTRSIHEEMNLVLGEHLMSNTLSVETTSPYPVQPNWQIPEETSHHVPKFPMSHLLSSEIGSDFEMDLFEERMVDGSLELGSQLFNIPGCSADKHTAERNSGSLKFQSYSQNEVPSEESHVLKVKCTLLNESLKKVDSFSRWVTKELGEVDDLQMQSSSGLSWTTVECGNVIDDSSLSPSLSQDQLFSISDFWPKWGYADAGAEVMLIGKFLKKQQDVANCKWSCMFGELEVPAKVLADGILCCYAPPHKEGRVHFYVTCSNRLACSEVREFDYQEGYSDKIDVGDVYGNSTNELVLHLQLERALSLKPEQYSHFSFEDNAEKMSIITKLISLKEDEEISEKEEPPSEVDLSQTRVKELLLQKQLKGKLYSWLLHKVCEDGKGPSILDEHGLGVLHLAAALGHDWAITPIVTSGVSINFRDVNGWAALHWAASNGREKTVAVLVFLGASPGLLTDPSPAYPLGRTPADLASSNGHKGISGFLAEFALTSTLASLTVDDNGNDAGPEVCGLTAVQTISDRTLTSGLYGDVAEELSLKDSLTAVSNATQAVHRIYQVYRMQSFQRKQFAEVKDEELELLDQHSLSLLASRTSRRRRGDGLAHAAATHIQKNFRGWKKRKEFLFIRQRIVKIQALVRGHQVRKKYKSIIWTVGILEKVILRWRRKGSGLRGFRPEGVNKDDNQQGITSGEDDYDFLKEGRKQTEERLQKALTRVKSMVEYPEARAQYQRLLNVVDGFRENKACNMDVINSDETVDGLENLTDLDMLLDGEISYL